MQDVTLVDKILFNVVLSCHYGDSKHLVKIHFIDFHTQPNTSQATHNGAVYSQCYCLPTMPGFQRPGGTPHENGNLWDLELPTRGVTPGQGGQRRDWNVEKWRNQEPKPWHGDQEMRLRFRDRSGSSSQLSKRRNLETKWQLTNSIMPETRPRILKIANPIMLAIKTPTLKETHCTRALHLVRHGVGSRPPCDPDQNKY